MKLVILPFAALLLCAAAARPQDVAAATSTSRQPVDFADASDAELPFMRRAVEDEALHRERLSRIHRLREIYSANGDRARLARLDDLERRELQLRDARRVRTQAGMSERSWTRTQDFVRSGGTFRVRAADKQAYRERMAAHKAQRERSAAASQASRPASSSSRGSSSSPSRSSAPSRSGGGRSPR